MINAGVYNADGGQDQIGLDTAGLLQPVQPVQPVQAGPGADCACRGKGRSSPDAAGFSGPVGIQPVRQLQAAGVEVSVRRPPF